MVKILEQLQKSEIQKIKENGEVVIYYDYVCPKFKNNQYLALTVKGKLCHPSNNKPYITRNHKNHLFDVMRYSKGIYAMVLVEVEDIKQFTLLND